MSIHADSVRRTMLVKQLSSLKCAYHNIKDAPIEQGPDTQKHLSPTYLSAVHVTAVKTTYFIRVYTQNSD